MTSDELQIILDAHLKWLCNEDGGKAADFSHANLEGMDFQHKDLSYANFTGANLREAKLLGICLEGANLVKANLARADLGSACLDQANLSETILVRANLIETNFSEANLQGTDLRAANITGADLSKARLSDIMVSHETAGYWPVLPDGNITVWKACRNQALVRLYVPAKARRSSATTRKARVEYAVVKEVIGATEGISGWATSYAPLTYRLGETVRCHEWCENRWEECAGGIHVFLTREEAKAWAENW